MPAASTVAVPPAHRQDHHPARQRGPGFLGVQPRRSGPVAPAGPARHANTVQRHHRLRERRVGLRHGRSVGRYPGFSTRQTAAFAQVDWKARPDLSFSGGLRHQRTAVTVENFVGVAQQVLIANGAASSERWQPPQVPVIDRVDPSLAQRALTQLPGGHGAWRRVMLSYPSPELPRLVLTARPVQGESQRFAVSADGVPTPLAEPWSAFLHDLHERLLLPGMAGLIQVGIVGVAMLALALGGVPAHPRLFRDAFQFRAGAGERRRQADLHNRLSVRAAADALRCRHR